MKITIVALAVVVPIVAVSCAVCAVVVVYCCCCRCCFFDNLAVVVYRCHCCCCCCMLLLLYIAVCAAVVFAIFAPLMHKLIKILLNALLSVTFALMRWFLILLWCPLGRPLSTSVVNETIVSSC